MEKRTPHYDVAGVQADVAGVQADVARLGAAAFTKSALDRGRALGLTS
jgi:motility quorum-sensing regulator / GCU-specific mRNA interferase toxin